MVFFVKMFGKEKTEISLQKKFFLIIPDGFHCKDVWYTERLKQYKFSLERCFDLKEKVLQLNFKIGDH